MAREQKEIITQLQEAHKENKIFYKFRRNRNEDMQRTAKIVYK